MTHARRTALLCLTLVLSTACATWSSLHSETYIAGGTAFLLGGSQAGSFQATVKNTGAVPVTVLVEANGVRREVIVLAPDSTIEAELQAGETAVFSNPSPRPATVKLDARGDTRALGMRYDSVRVR